MVDVLRGTLTALHDVARFDWAALMTVDPQTLLPTGGLVEGFDPANCAPFWDHELLLPGYNKFSSLARSTDVVATLSDATDGDLRRAPIYTSIYAPLGAADELRAAFNVGTTCWGVASLVRAASDGVFSDREVADVRALAPLIARALRTATCRLDAETNGSATMLIVDAANNIRHRTLDADTVLRDLHSLGIDEPALPTLIAAVATRARHHRSSSHLATRVRGNSGRWLRVTAVPTEDEDGTVAVIIEPARPIDLLPIMLETYGLTERETDIVVMLARGCATKEIAAELSLSTHTVRDHIKSIFDKTGVSSRGELVARLFSDHLVDAFHAAVHTVG